MFESGAAAMFAIAMSLVLLTSTALLLYQFWTGALVGEDAAAGDVASPRPLPDEPARPAPSPGFRTDTAA
jgi:hypothetical protein